MSQPVTPAELQRLRDAAHKGIPWKKWGPYLSERQWGTVRENMDPTSRPGTTSPTISRGRAPTSAARTAWRDVRRNMLLCFALGLWNGKDPILKERMFGLTNSEGNHGEDVKEYYFYLDSTPTHSYAKMLYKYPQAPFPYDQLVSENRRRSRNEFEYELLDTGVFDEDRYWDVFVEYAKADPEDMLSGSPRQSRAGAGDAAPPAPLWFRNTWSARPRARPCSSRRSRAPVDRRPPR